MCHVTKINTKNEVEMYLPMRGRTSTYGQTLKNDKGWRHISREVNSKNVLLRVGTAKREGRNLES